MPSPLHLLILEDRPADAELMLHELRRAGLAADWRRVETEADYVAALDPALDLILADYTLPQFNALRALQLLQQRGLDIPFIIVTGSIREEVAVECMKQGAADYLLKDRLTRLGQAVAHALEQKRLRVESQRAAEALRESEARFRVIFEQANDAIYLSNAADEILEVNPRLCEMMGYSRAELLKLHIADLQAPEVRASAGSVITNELARHGSTTFEGLNLHHSGRPIPVEISVARMASAQDELFVSIVRDITERKRAEDALRGSEEKFRKAFLTSPDSININRLADGMYISINSGFSQIMGYNEEEVIGKTSLELNIWADPEDRKALVEGLTKSSEVVNLEARFRAKNGDIHDGLMSASVFELNNAPHIISITRDITERKRAEQALRASEQKYRKLHESMIDGFVYVDMQGNIIDSNPSYQQMLGYSFEELTRRTYRDLTPEKWHAAEQAIVDEQILPRGYSDIYQKEYRRKDGTIFPIEIHTFLIKNDAGEHEGMWAIVRDITERKQAEDALRESQRRLSTLMSNLPGMAYRCNNDRDWTMEFVSEGCQALTGYEPQRLLNSQGIAYAELIHPADRDRVWDIVQAGVQAKQPYHMEYRIQTAGGLVKWVWEQGQAIHTETGELSALEGLITDITERKRMEVQLREQVATLQALADIDREITAAMEPKGILELVCRHAAELVHAPKSAIVTRTAADEMDMPASYGLRDVARVSAEFARVQQAGLMNFDVLKTRGAIVLNEITAGTRVMPETISAEGVRALAIVPLAAGEELLGALIVFDTTARQWQAADLQILSMLAGQAALALEKLRLLETARSRALHLATLNEIGQAITSSLDLDLVLTTLLEKVRQATNAEACSVALIEKASGDLVFRQAVGGVAYAVIGLRLPPGEGLAGWVAQHRQSVLVTDVASDVRSYQLRDRGNFVTRDLIGVPLIARDVVTGVIELVNKRSGRFGEDDRRLLESVAAQAAIAIENARLFETEHAGREQLETLYRIGQAINSTLDADTILDRLTDEAMRATHATHGSALVARPDRGRFERRSLRGYSPEQTEQAHTDWLPLDRGVNGRAYRSQQAVYVDDVQLDPDYHPLIAETHSELAVPIIRGGQVIGNLDLQSPTVGAFRTVRLDFLQALTDQVAIALENARLFEGTRRQMDEMSIVSQVALVGAAGRPFDETVARATNALSRLWPTASLGFWFVDEGSQSLHLHPAHHGASPLITATVSVPVDQGLTGWAVRERQPIRVGDVAADPRHFLKIPEIRSEMAAPLVVGQRVIGVVDVACPWLDAFSGDDLRLLTTLAGQLATIFEKARLDAELVGHAARLEQRVQERTAEIRREQARTQAILDALGEGVVVTDTRGMIQYMNPAMEQATGYSASESIGQNSRLWQSGQTPVEVYQAMWATVLAGQTWHGEIINRRKDGELYFASFSAAPIPTTSSRAEPIAGFVGIQRDITERKHAEAALRESEALYHSLVEVMPQNLCRKDLAGRFTFANHQFLAELKWSLADLIGKTDFDIHPPALAEKYQRDDQQVISTGQILEVIEERTVPGGKLLYMQTVKAPILNNAGNVVGVQITFWDVSVRIQAEEEMRRALEKEKELNNLKSNFVSLTSHEFRTPLTTILSSAEMLEYYGAGWTTERKHEHLHRIQTAVKYMTTLLNDILIIGKAEAGKLEFRPTPLDLVKFCRDLMEELQLTDKANHTLIFDSQVEYAQVSMDEHLLRHILSNVLSNALKYSPQGGIVQFDLICQTGQAVFRIQDHGMGIPLEDQARLFETFQRASNVRNIAGTGLGLAIVKRSVDLHGGTIDVASQVGVGTTVTVTLPLGASSDA